MTTSVLPSLVPQLQAPTATSGATLRVLVEPERSARHNMQRDAALLAAQPLGAVPVLCLYSWTPPALSLGNMQRAAQHVDLEACGRDGIDVVQRPTGGRAVLHWEEITYALVASLDDDRFGPSLRAAHAVIGRCLAAAIRQLGIDCELSRPASQERNRLMLRQPCFASVGRAELLVHGRKLAGSAQRRTRTAFLQHGSLLVGQAHTRIVRYLLDTSHNAALAAAAERRLRNETVCLEELLGRRPGLAELQPVMVRGFEQTLLGSPPQVATPPVGAS